MTSFLAVELLSFGGRLCEVQAGAKEREYDASYLHEAGVDNLLPSVLEYPAGGTVACSIRAAVVWGRSKGWTATLQGYLPRAKSLIVFSLASHAYDIKFKRQTLCGYYRTSTTELVQHQTTVNRSVSLPVHFFLEFLFQRSFCQSVESLLVEQLDFVG